MFYKKGGRAHSLSYISSEPQVEVSVQFFFFKEAVIVRILFSSLCFLQVKLTMKSCGCSVKPAYLSSGGDRALGVDCFVCGTEKLHAFKTFSNVEKRKENLM